MLQGENTRPSKSAPAGVNRKASSTGVCQRRKSSTAIAISRATKALVRREPGDAGITTRKNTIVPQSTEPPYLTNGKDSPIAAP